MSVETLTLSISKEIFGIIKDYFSKRKTSKCEKEQLKQNLIKLIHLSQNTNIALEKYAEFRKRATEASVHCTELYRLAKKLEREQIQSQFEKLIDTRMKANLRKEGLEAIRDFSEDFHEARDHYRKAFSSIRLSELGLDSGKIEKSLIELDIANKELDYMVMLGNRRIEELLKSHLEAYKVLENLEKVEEN